MKRIILFIVILGLFSAVSCVRHTTYMVDDVPIENFDGSVLKGKTIKDYTVTMTGVGRKTTIVHNITTETGSLSGRPYQIDFVGENTAVFRWKSGSTTVNLSESHEGRTYIHPDSHMGRTYIHPASHEGGEYIYYIDGVEYSPSDFKFLSSRDIRNISIIKAENGLNIIKIETGTKRVE